MIINKTASDVALFNASTEALESELKERSGAIERHQSRFREVQGELRRRRDARDEQPPPETTEQASERNRNYEQKLGDNLVLKVTMMETEQARLVVELESAKAAQRDAEERLALVIKTGVCIPASKVVELTAAIRDVPLDSSPESERAWIAKVHLAACAVAGVAAPMPIAVIQAEHKREPMTRDAAIVLAINHAGSNLFDAPGYNWVIDAIVEASK